MLGDLLELCANVTKTAARPVHIADQLLLDHGVEPWSELPFWAPRGVGADGIWSTDCSAARAAGLHLRPLAETVVDTWSWMQSIGAASDVALLPVSREGIGLSTSKQSRLLATLRN